MKFEDEKKYDYTTTILQPFKKKQSDNKFPAGKSLTLKGQRS